MNLLCERPCGRAPALTHSQCAAALRRSRRDFKEQCLSNGGRKVVGGQWPGAFQYFLAVSTSRKLDYSHARTYFVRQSHRLNNQGGITGAWPKRDEEDLIFVVVH